MKKWGLLSFFIPFLPMGVGELRLLNLYGMETELMDCQCSFQHPCEYYMEQTEAMGFNGYRIPFSAEYVKRGDFSVLDRVVKKATELNTPLMLDYHRTYASHQGNWYETNLEDFLGVWQTVLYRYYDKPIVQWVDLYNEFQDGNDKAPFWSEIMEQAITRLENLFPRRYNWVVGGSNWGGNLHGIEVDLPYDNIYYTIHKYQFSIGAGGDYRKDWDYSFNRVAPDKLIVGEYGWISERPDQVAWAEMFLSYLKEKGYRNTAFWTIALSGDTNGIYDDRCINVDEGKLQILREFWGLPRHLTSDIKTFLGGDNSSSSGGINSEGDDGDYNITLGIAGKYAPIPIPNQGCQYKPIMNETDDETDDFEGRKLRWGKRRKKCHWIDEPSECIRHSVCCYGEHYGCWKCVN